MKKNYTLCSPSAISDRRLLTAIIAKASFILLLLEPSLSFSQGCPIPNIDFTDTTAGGWVCKSGWYGTGPCPVQVVNYCPTFNTVLNLCAQMNPHGIDAPLNTQDRQTIMDMHSYGNTGIDPNSIFPQIHTVSPFGGGNCFRIGEGITGGTNTTVCYTGGCLGPGCYARAEAIRLTFIVTMNNAGFTYAYSAFLQNGGHQPEEQPRFEVLVTLPDSGDQLIPCGYYKVISNNSDPYCPGTISNFHIGATNWQYSDWTTVFVDLTSYVGQNIAVEFRTSDCFPDNAPTSIINGVCTTTITKGDTCVTGPSLAACPDSGTCHGTYTCTNQPGQHSAYAYIAATCGPSPLLGYNPIICAGPSVTIHAPVGYCTYSWLPINYSSTTDSVVINNPVAGTTYTVDMVSCTGCATQTTITIHGTDTAVVTVVGDTLFSSHATSYQWYLNGNIIAGATDSFYVWHQGGTYSVGTTDSIGCSSLSQGLILAIQEISGGGGINIYPNPASQSAVVSWQSTVRGNIEITVVNMLGEKVYAWQSEIRNQKSEIMIDISSLANGVYFLKIDLGDRTVNRKFVVVH